jgi:hypothetical protein
MPNSYDDRIKQQAQPYLEAGEHVLGAFTNPIAMGRGGDVKDLISAAPLSDVDSIEIKRLLVGKIVIVTVRGAAIKLEAGRGANATGFAQEFARARTTA